MSGADVAVLIVLLVVVAAVAFGALLLVRKVRAKKAAIAAMSPAERAVYDAERQYALDVKQATKDRNLRVKQHKSLVSAAERDLVREQRAGHETTASLMAKGGASRITPLAIWLNGRVHDLTPSIRADVDAVGNVDVNRRTTATRVAAGAIVAGPVGAIVGATAKKRQVNDFRELYVTVTGEGFSEVLVCKPESGEAARKFAAAVNAAAMNVEAVRAQRDAAVAQATARLDAVRGDTRAIDDAEARLATVTADRSRIEHARSALPVEGTVRG